METTKDREFSDSFCNEHADILKRLASDYAARFPEDYAVDKSRPDWREYTPEKVIMKCLDDKMFNLGGLIGDMDLKGKKVLDIACGSKLNRYGVSFEPWIARALTALGAKVTGVDIHPAPGEPYEHIVMDVINESLEERLGGRKFDLAINKSFFSADEVVMRHPFIPIFKKLAREVFPLLEQGGLYYVDPPLDYGSQEIFEGAGFEIDFDDASFIIGKKPEGE